MMNIKPLTKTDINQCVEIFIKAYNCPPWNYNWTATAAAKYLSAYIDTPYFLGFGLYEGDKMAAAVFAHRKTWWTGDLLFIDELFVSGDKQRSGYGKEISKHIEKFAKEQGINVISLMTNKFMPSYKFYIQNNFTPADQFTFMFKSI